MSAEIKRLEKKLHKEREAQIFVKYLSPGTFFSETTRVEVKRCDLLIALEQAKEIVERHNARPYGLLFEDGNGKVITGIYYLTGEILRLDDISDTEENRIMRLNMSDPDSSVMVENRNSFKFCAIFYPKDVVIDWSGHVIRRGNEPELTMYRQAQADKSGCAN